MTRRLLVVTLALAVLLSAIPSSAATRRLGLLSLGAGGRSAERELLMETLAKPADIPVEEPTTFDLTVNARAARALGLTLPKSVSARATRIVE